MYFVRYCVNYYYYYYNYYYYYYYNYYYYYLYLHDNYFSPHLFVYTLFFVYFF